METIEFPFMVLLRTAPAGMFAYAPKGPSVKIQKSEYGILLEELALAVQPWLPPLLQGKCRVQRTGCKFFAKVVQTL